MAIERRCVFTRNQTILDITIDPTAITQSSVTNAGTARRMYHQPLVWGDCLKALALQLLARFQT